MWSAIAFEAAAAPALIPRPLRMEERAGTWTLGARTRIVAAADAASEAWKLSDALSGPLGRRLLVVASGARSGDIVLRLDAGRVDLGEEGYELEVAADSVQAVARRPAGLFYAGQTLRQLLPAAAWRSAPSNGPWSAPCVRIVDTPRFAWRGLLLDPARHFISKAGLRQIIDAMAMHKLNRLQLHLTDDQGWRVEIRSFPLLTARSSWRDGTLIGHLRQDGEAYSNVPHGGYYSQDDIREIVAYAAARHIVVVPEIEMPGHARAWLAAYPEFAVFPEKAAGMDLWKRWGVSKDVLAPRPPTIEACRRILDEICEMFPSQWIHTGGDEAPRDQWRESPEVQALIRSLGLADEDELQAWFTAELSRYLASNGRRLVGWDEILAGAKLGGSTEKTALAPNAVVMSWRGEKGGQAAAAAGHDVIMAPNQWTYLDYLQGPKSEEPLAIGGSISLLRTQAYEPIPAGLSEEAARRVIGAQAQVWSEYLPSFDAVGYMTFPRASALAESFWSPREGRQFSDFIRRMERHEARLKALGIPYRPLARRTSWPGSAGKIAAKAEDAVIHGTDIVRQPDGALAGWKDPFTAVAWRVQLRGPGRYRVQVLAESPEAFEVLLGGQLLRAAGSGPALFQASASGPYLLVVRAHGEPAAGGLPALRGVELAPAH
jgi:hexosaminidase